MMSPFRWILSVYRTLFFLGLAGGLIDATLAMKTKAAKAQRTGLISLSVLNRQLQRER